MIFLLIRLGIVCLYVLFGSILDLGLLFQLD